MIGALKSLFAMPAQQESAPQTQQRLELAAAALLIETARADFSQDASEEAALASLLVETLGLSTESVDALVVEASQSLDQSTSLYEYTRLINANYSAEQKLQLIAAMWRVAYADGDLDKYEEHLIRQVAELTYVAHSDYIKTKLAAQRAAEG